MNEERRRILTMLAEGKISADEAEALLDAMTRGTPALVSGASSNGTQAAPKYLRVLVEGHEEGHSGKVNVRVPFNLIRAGVKLAALIPAAAHGPVNKALKEQGIDFDVSKLKPEDLDELVQHLTDLSVDVEGGRGEKVRVFCE
jgi:hypothetical protein